MHPFEISPGTIVGVPVAFFFEHVGIISNRVGPDALPMVISSTGSLGRVAEQTWTEFSGERRVRMVGYPSKLPSATVVANARAKLDEPWNLLTENCEHFAYAAHGMKPNSPQLAKVVMLMAIGGSLLALRAS